MSRIPSYAFRVMVYRRTAGDPYVEHHNHKELAGAIAGRDIALRKRNTIKVEVMMVIDETTPDRHAQHQQEVADRLAQPPIPRGSRRAQ